MGEEFDEIGHAGGKITIEVSRDEQGRRTLQEEYRHERPSRVVVTAISALPPGIPVPWITGRGGKARLLPGAVRVTLVSDSEGRFGHACPECGTYWRSGSHPNVCPHCGVRASDYEFLSDAQQRYIREFCVFLETAVRAGGSHVIDLDAVADAAGKEGEKPPFYTSERSRQTKFTCRDCGEFNDILGRVGYCSSCGTRSDLAHLETEVVPAIRERLNAGTPPELCLGDAISAFDSFLSQYAQQLARHVPLTKARRQRLEDRAFQDPAEFRPKLRDWFDIDVAHGVADWPFVVRMFARRHVHEHKFGQADQRYLETSGDNTVALNQLLRETREEIHSLLGCLSKMAKNIHDGFHELLPPVPGPIEKFKAREDRRQK